MKAGGAWGTQERAGAQGTRGGPEGGAPHWDVSSWNLQMQERRDLSPPGKGETEAAPFSTAAWGARKLPWAGLLVPEDQTAAHSQPHAQGHQGGIQFCFQGLMSGKPYLNVPSHEACEDACP